MEKEQKKESVRVTFYVKKKVAKKIKEESVKERRSMSNYIETLLVKIYEM